MKCEILIILIEYIIVFLRYMCWYVILVNVYIFIKNKVYIM